MRRIRLTESKLRRLIESTINEMDWKSYMAASEKADDNAEKIYQDYLDDLRGANDMRDAYEEYGMGFWEDDNDYSMLSDEDYDNFDKSERFPEYQKNQDRSADFAVNAFDLLKKKHNGDKKKADAELDDYYAGKSKYVRGKGWVPNDDLDESRRRMVNKLTESVIRRLRRR